MFLYLVVFAALFSFFVVFSTLPGAVGLSFAISIAGLAAIALLQELSDRTKETNSFLNAQLRQFKRPKPLHKNLYVAVLCVLPLVISHLVS